MATYIADVKDSVGDKVVQQIFEEAERGRITTKQGEKLAAELGKKGEKVSGNFVRRKRNESAIDGAEVEHILSDWWNDGDGCNETNPKETLFGALEEAKLTTLLHKLLKLDVNANVVDAGNEAHIQDDGSEHIGLVSLKLREPVFRRAKSVENQWKCNLPRRWKKRWILPLPTAVFLVLGGFVTYEYLQQKYNLTSTRTMRIGGSKEPSTHVTEIHSCPSKQLPIPDLKNPLTGHVSIQINPTQTLVCGGTDRSSHNAKSCVSFNLGSEEWDDFPYVLNEVRINAHAKLSNKKVYIIGGESSHPTTECRNSQEVLNLENMEDGWRLEPVDSDTGVNLCFPSQTTVEIPCI